MFIRMKSKAGSCRKAVPASRRRSILSHTSLNYRVAAPSNATPGMGRICRSLGYAMPRTLCRID